MNLNPIQLLSAIQSAGGKSPGQGGASAMGLPSLPGSASAFADMLRGALQSGGSEALDLATQFSLGGQFMAQMSGVDAAQMTEMSEMNMLMDAISGAKDQDGGGLGMLGLSGSGLPFIPGGPAPGGMDMARIAELLRTQAQEGAAVKDAMAQAQQTAQPAPRLEQAAAAAHFASVRPAAPEVLPAAAPGVELASRPAPVSAPAAPRTLETAKAALAHKAYGAGAARDPFGQLSARFESGGQPGAVGFDRVGGTSYGIYQISSKAGTFDRFLSFLQHKAPDMAQRLAAAGPADTGSKSGPMPSAWKTLAHDEPSRFAEMQHEFIRETHYLPALRKVADLTGVDLSARHQAVAQVLWSTAVQHGATGSARIFAKALEAVGGMDAPGADKNLIQAVYADRAGQFGSSSDRVRGAVRSRFSGELKAALTLLDGGADSLFDSNV
ncbi:VgrG-related protein [Desulfocurvus sp. DL9XJH121]